MISKKYHFNQLNICQNLQKIKRECYKYSHKVIHNLLQCRIYITYIKPLINNTITKNKQHCSGTRLQLLGIISCKNVNNLSMFQT